MPLLQEPYTNKKIFFAHPPRTGGRTVEEMFVKVNNWDPTLTSMHFPSWWTNELSLKLMQMKPKCLYYKNVELSHLCYDGYRDFIDPSIVPSFVVCRNPLTRFQSYVYYVNYASPLNPRNLVETAEGRKYLFNNWDEQDIFLKPQFKYCNRHIKIWKFENGFGPEFINWINKEFNLNLKFFPTNKALTKRDTQSKKEPLHPELVEFLKEKYEVDFNYFGYPRG